MFITLPEKGSFGRVPGEFYDIFQNSLSSEYIGLRKKLPHLVYKLGLGFQILLHTEFSANERLTRKLKRN